jgi:pimeloyl-ACP methyl ester carboxylesterase
MRAAEAAGHMHDTLIVAPVFEMPVAEARACSFKGVPQAVRGDAVWKCDDWADGGKALNGNATSFQMMDRLVALLVKQDRAARVVTLAGFSAGGQFVQRYAGFANPPASVAMRYVVSDPSSFVYFDKIRPQPFVGSCRHFNDWKFGLDKLPGDLGRDGPAARQAYAAADITYMEGALDDSAGPGTAAKLLAHGCAAELQGSFRRQRGEAYAQYDAKYLAHGAHRLVVVPGCAHSVSCVFPNPAARAVLFQ